MGVAVWLHGHACSPALRLAAPGVLSCSAGALALLRDGSGLAVYALAILLSGAVEVRQLRALLRRRPPP